MDQSASSAHARHLYPCFPNETTVSSSSLRECCNFQQAKYQPIPWCIIDLIHIHEECKHPSPSHWNSNSLDLGIHQHTLVVQEDNGLMILKPSGTKEFMVLGDSMLPAAKDICTCKSSFGKSSQYLTVPSYQTGVLYCQQPTTPTHYRQAFKYVMTFPRTIYCYWFFIRWVSHQHTSSETFKTVHSKNVK